MYIKENLTFLDSITTINLSEPTMPYKLKLILCVGLVAVITSVDGGICVKILLKYFLIDLKYKM